MTKTDACTNTTMRAIVQDTYGTADVLRLARITRPQIAEDEVLVHVRAAGLDRLLPDIHVEGHEVAGNETAPPEALVPAGRVPAGSGARS